MFKELFHPNEQEIVRQDAISSIEAQDFRTFISNWGKLDPKSRDVVVQSVFVTTDFNFAQSLFRFFKEQFEQSDIEERENIVKALGGLGARCPAIDLESGEFLLNQIDGGNENKPAIIRSLQDKAGRFILPLSIGQKIPPEQEVIAVKISEMLCAIIKNNDENDESRLAAISGTANLVVLEQSRVNIENALRASVEDKNLREAAVEELAQIVEAGDSQVLEFLHSKISSSDLSTMPAQEKMRLVQNLGRIGTQESLNYLNFFSEDADQNVRADAEWARQKISERLITANE